VIIFATMFLMAVTMGRFGRRLIALYRDSRLTFGRAHRCIGSFCRFSGFISALVAARCTFFFCRTLGILKGFALSLARRFFCLATLNGSTAFFFYAIGK